MGINPYEDGNWNGITVAAKIFTLKPLNVCFVF